MNTTTQHDSQQQRKGFTFYRSYKEAIAMLPEQDQLAIYRAITDYALDGTEPDTDSLSLYCRLVWTAFLPNLQSDRQKYANGCRGGAPKGNSNATQTDSQPENNRKTTEAQPTDNRKTTNVKENVKEKENVNVEGKDNVNANAAADATADGKVAPSEGSHSAGAATQQTPPSPREKKSLELFENWVRQHAPTLLEFTEPMTAIQLAALRAKHTDRDILECASQMHNKNAYQNNRSAYITMRKWLK